jgi:caffeoyl-CoA O-methyltransferase
MAKYVALDDALAAYVLSHRTPDDDVLQALREETARLGERAVMQIAPDQGTFLNLLVSAMGARWAVEVGTFTGYSAICIARGLGRGGHLLCCDVSEEWTAVARRYWAKAGLLDRIELRLGDAQETLRGIPRDTSFDFAFIDANKPAYLAYYEAILPRLRVGGLVAVDNVLWSGEVLNPEMKDENTLALRAFNEHVAADRRVQSVMVPIADGLTLARKLGP